MLDGILRLEELEIENQRLLVRADFDDALGEGRSATERDVKALLPTLLAAQAKGARVVIAAHSGSIGQKPTAPVSLEPVAERLSALLGTEIYLPDDAVGDAARKVVQDLRPGQVCLLENLGFHAEEAANDDGFAHKLARFADVYVNDALRASRDARTSVDALARLLPRRGAGAALTKELHAIARIRERSEKPLAVVAGGSDATTELTLVEALLDRIDILLAGDALGITLLAARGVEMRASPVDPSLLARGRALLVRARDTGIELKLPVDLLSAESADGEVTHPVAVTGLTPGSMALGIGPKTLEVFGERLLSAKTILFTGPLGLGLNRGPCSETLQLFRSVAEGGSYSVVIGSDASLAIERADPELASKMGCVSTGGPATLELLLGGKLPGIEALRGGAT